MATLAAREKGGTARLLRWTLLLALLLALAALVLLASGPLGWRFGLWHYRVAFQNLMPWAAYCGLAAMAVAAVAVAAIGLAVGWRGVRARHIAIGAIAFLLGAAVASVPWGYDRMRGMVPNDITTDLDNPPVYVAVLPLRKAANASNAGDYNPAKAEQQRRNYPDISPATVDLPRDQAFERAVATVQRLGWTMIAMDPGAGRVEASERSRWFGFTDDVVIRVTPAASGSRVDIRSSSRLGTGDFGVNAKRVRAYLAALSGKS